jgi:hypothetical protein
MFNNITAYIGEACGKFYKYLKILSSNLPDINTLGSRISSSKTAGPCGPGGITHR